MVISIYVKTNKVIHNEYVITYIFTCVFDISYYFNVDVNELEKYITITYSVPGGLFFLTILVYIYIYIYIN